MIMPNTTAAMNKQTPRIDKSAIDHFGMVDDLDDCPLRFDMSDTPVLFIGLLSPITMLDTPGQYDSKSVLLNIGRRV